MKPGSFRLLTLILLVLFSTLLFGLYQLVANQQKQILTYKCDQNLEDLREGILHHMDHTLKNLQGFAQLLTQQQVGQTESFQDILPAYLEGYYYGQPATRLIQFTNAAGQSTHYPHSKLDLSEPLTAHPNPLVKQALDASFSQDETGVLGPLPLQSGGLGFLFFCQVDNPQGTRDLLAQLCPITDLFQQTLDLRMKNNFNIRLWANGQLMDQSGSFDHFDPVPRSFRFMQINWRLELSPNGALIQNGVASVRKQIVALATLIFFFGVSVIYLAHHTYSHQLKMEREFKHLFAQGPIPAFISQNCQIKVINQKMAEHFGTQVNTPHATMENLFCLPANSHWYLPERKPCTRDQFETVFRNMPVNESIQFLWEFQKNGETRYFETVIGRILWQDQPAILGFLNDTTTTQKLMQANEQVRTQQNNILGHIDEAILLEEQTQLSFLNDRCVKLLGYDAHTPLNVINLAHQEDRSHVRDAVTELRTGISKQVSCTFRIQHAQGDSFWCHLNGFSVQWEGKKARLYFIRDISIQKQLETQLFQAQKLEAIGTLAGGIAHDFNNLLQGINGYISLLLYKENLEEDKRQQHLKSIQKIVDSASKLTKQLLGFARGGNYHVKPILINKVINKSLDLFGRAKQGLEIKAEFENALWTVEVDEGQMEQVLVNLFMNAWEAMPNGGTITIRTENVKPSPSFCHTHEIEPGHYIRLSVQDTGIGMDEETLKHIFEPFFSKNPKKRGTGLGLASAYGIVRNHKGAIEAKSEEGKGSTLNLYLPISHKTYVELDETTGAFFIGNETILMIDDEEEFLNISAEMFGALGYRILKANSGPQALSLYKERQKDIALVILDMVMPEMGGDEIFTELKALNPQVRVLIASGYSLSAKAQGMIDQGALGFLHKPFNMKVFSGKVREILDQEKKA